MDEGAAFYLDVVYYISIWRDQRCGVEIESVCPNMKSIDCYMIHIDSCNEKELLRKTAME